MERLFPASIHTIGLISPASRPDADRVASTRRFLEESGIKTVLAPNAIESDSLGYCCGSPEMRLSDFHTMLNDPRIDLILCTCGGFGCAHLLPGLDFDLLRERNLPVYGQSDISALHLAMFAKHAGIPVCSPTASRLSESLGYESSRRSFRNVLRKHSAPRKLVLESISSSSDTTISGGIVLSNLTVMTTLCGTPWMPDLHSCVLALEDVREDVYIIDRNLTHLIQAGVIDQVQAVIFGYFVDCGPEDKIRELIRCFAARTGKPVFCGLEFGHKNPKNSYRLGEQIEIISAGRKDLCRRKRNQP